MTVKQLERILKKTRTKKCELAGALGYKDPSSISKWIEREHIPRHTQELVRQFFKKEKGYTCRF